MQRSKLDEAIIKDYGTSDVVFEPCYGDAAALDATLVLEGGSMRSLFSAGVLDVFLSHGLYFKRVIGVSAGALMGYNYVAGLIGRGAYINMKYCPDWRYFSLRSFAITGNMFNRSMSFDLIPHILDPFPNEALTRSPMQLIAVASDLENGIARYLPVVDPERDMVALDASSSQPIVSQIIDYQGMKLLDGGAADSVPIRYALLTADQKTVVICTHDADYIRKPNPLMPLISQIYRNYPRFIELLRRRHLDYNETYRLLKALHRQREAYVFWPETPVTIRNDEHDPAALLDLYEQGVACAFEHLDPLNEYLTAP